MHPCLSSTVPRWPSSKVSSFCPSASLCLLHLSPFCPRHNSSKRSFFMRVLSHSDTHYLNRHMVGCGCHEILIQRCITVLFLSNIPLYLIQRWFRWLRYSNHSCQLISIQYSVYFSDSVKNHQCCNQEPFISISHWRQAHIQRHIICCHSNIAYAFIVSTVYQILSLAKSKALAVPETSQHYLSYNSKYRRHETMTVTSIDIL